MAPAPAWPALRSAACIAASTRPSPSRRAPEGRRELALDEAGRARRRRTCSRRRSRARADADEHDRRLPPFERPVGLGAVGRDRARLGLDAVDDAHRSARDEILELLAQRLAHDVAAVGVAVQQRAGEALGVLHAMCGGSGGTSGR